MTLDKPRTIFGVQPIKFVFALEYVLQGLANPFQGITYQPFFRHFRMDYGLSEAQTQGLFARSYLAWSFKPVIGFLIDAYGKTRTLLLVLLAAAALGFLVTPVVDRSVLIFFWFMFGLSVILAATDVAVDRATVIVGDAEAKETGRSRAATVGLNQAICWTAIYGTGILAAALGGYVAEHVPFDALMVTLAAIPLVILLVVLLLPRDRAPSIPLKSSIGAFWGGLYSGPILGVMVFYFIFHFQPALGPIFNNYLIESLHFTQTEIGVADGAAYGGLFLGVLIFAWQGIRWQGRLGMRRIFRLFIVASVLINLTQYAMVDPWFTRNTTALRGVLPFLDEPSSRVVYYSAYNVAYGAATGIVRMSTFSLVGAVIPVAAAGSLFAGFMSVSNLAYSFCYSSGAWLYDHGMSIGPIRELQASIFGIPGGPGDSLSISMLILFGSLAYLLSFAAAHLLPDRRETLRAEVPEEEGPARWNALPPRFKRGVDIGALVGGAVLLAAMALAWKTDVITGVLVAFFGMTLLRKAILDTALRRVRGGASGRGGAPGNGGVSAGGRP